MCELLGTALMHCTAKFYLLKEYALIKQLFIFISSGRALCDLFLLIIFCITDHVLFILKMYF